MGFLFASLFKRDNGVWYILYTHQGRQRWISTKTKQKAEALKRLKSFQEPPADQPKSISLSEFTKEFLAFAEVNYSRGSRAIFKVCLRHLLLVAGDCKLQAIMQRHVDSYKTARLQTKSPVSVNIELRSLRTILS